MRMVSLAACVLTIFTALAHAEPPATATATGMITRGIDADGKIHVASGKAVTLDVARPYKRLTIGKPDTASVDPISPTQVLVSGHAAGETTLIIWDDNNASQSVDVLVSRGAGAAADAGSRGRWELAKDVPISVSTQVPGFLRLGFRNAVLFVPVNRVDAVVVMIEKSVEKATRLIFAPTAASDLPTEVTIPANVESPENVLAMLREAKAKQ